MKGLPDDNQEPEVQLNVRMTKEVGSIISGNAKIKIDEGELQTKLQEKIKKQEEKTKKLSARMTHSNGSGDLDTKGPNSRN